MSETLVQKQVRLVLEQQTREVGAVLAKSCPAGVGYALFLFDFGEVGNIAYVSNAQREDMIIALENLLERWKDGE